MLTDREEWFAFTDGEIAHRITGHRATLREGSRRYVSGRFQLCCTSDPLTGPDGRGGADGVLGLVKIDGLVL